MTTVRANGQSFKADGYVMAMGSYSPQLARTIGVDLPIYPIKGYSLTIPIGNHQAPRRSARWTRPIWWRSRASATACGSPQQRSSPATTRATGRRISRS